MRKVTIKDVADAAGVSIATVSFVLNDRPGQAISPPVRERVRKKARELNYSPSAAAAGLARKQTANLAIIFYQNAHLITNQLYSWVVQGALKQAVSEGFNVLFSFIDKPYSSYEDLPKIIREDNTEGVLFIQAVSAELVGELRRRGIRSVGVDSHPHVEGMEAVYVDNARGARIAVRHLLELGHRHIAFLRAGKDRPSVQQRSEAFLDELEQAGLAYHADEVFADAVEFTFDSGYDRARLLLQEQPQLTAIACANDELAAGVIRAARSLELRVPEDISVIGFDDIIMSRYYSPALSTIDCDKEGLGRVAMQRLIDLVRSQSCADPSHAHHPSLGDHTAPDTRQSPPPQAGDERETGLSLSVQLVKRESTAKPRS